MRDAGVMVDSIFATATVLVLASPFLGFSFK